MSEEPIPKLPSKDLCSTAEWSVVELARRIEEDASSLRDQAKEMYNNNSSLKKRCSILRLGYFIKLFRRYYI